MARIQKILFPVDFSSACDAMTPFVKRAAAMFAAKVTLMYVLEPPTSGFAPMARPLPDLREDRKKAACSELESYLRTEFPLQEAPRIVAEGEAAAQIARIAREKDFDAIIMPTHAGVFRRMLLGSTTAKVLNDADCLVMTTQHAETILPRGLEHREWVCAIGLTADSERVLRIATGLADEVGARLTIIHAVPGAAGGSPMQLDLEERVQSVERQAAGERVENLQKAVGSHARVSIASGPMKDVLTGEACRFQADMLIIGRSSQPGTQGRLRDLTYAVVRDAPCPVLSV